MSQLSQLKQNRDDRTELGRPLHCPLEEHGIDTIPESARKSTPWTFFIICTGNSFAFGSIVFGWLPITFGLSFWAALTSMAAGTVIGLIPLTPLLIISTRTHTNSSTSSGAHFGVRGRVIGSVLGLLLMLLGTAVAIWSGGQVLVATSARLLHTPTGNGPLALAYAIIALLSIVIAVWGYHLVARVSLVMMVFGIATTLLILVAFAAHLHPGYRGGHYVLGSFGATWLLSVLAIGVGGVMTAATIVGDWTRYIPADRYPPRRFLPVAYLALIISYIIPMGIGALVATAFAYPLKAFPSNVVAGAPVWYAVLLVPMAIFGGLAWSGSNLYSSGLDLDALFARLGRLSATTIVSVASVALVLLGSIVWSAAASFSALSLILLAATAPWAAVIAVGYLRCRGHYVPGRSASV